MSGSAHLKLLVVEDSPALAGVMSRLLMQHGFTVDLVAGLDEAWLALDLACYDLMILDLGLPDGDGGTLLRGLRQTGRTLPVLVATARGDVEERVQMLNAGADDYLVKPFSLDELLARVRAVLRRPATAREPIWAAGNVTLDLAGLSVSVAGSQLSMSRGEIKVLAELLAHRDRMIPRERLQQAVYSFNDDVTGNALEATVSRLRRRLAMGGATVTIVAMRGLGYILADAAA